jgi:hypothetical protein
MTKPLNINTQQEIAEKTASQTYIDKAKVVKTLADGMLGGNKIPPYVPLPIPSVWDEAYEQPVEQAAGWNYDSSESFPKKTLSNHLKEHLTLDAHARKAAAIKALDALAEQDAKKHIAQHDAVQRDAAQRKLNLDDLYDELESKPVTARSIHNYYDEFTKASIAAAEKQQQNMSSDFSKITEKLDSLEKQISQIKGNAKDQRSVLENAFGKPQTFVFNDSDLQELEKMLDGLDKKSPPPNIEYLQPTIEDLQKFAEILESAEVMRLSNSPLATPNDLHTYLEREAVMAKAKSGWVTEPDGTSKHYKNGVLHADGDQPAEIRPNGTNLFYKNGSLHRDGNLPAMVGVKGTSKFAVDGKYHRLGGLPAITWSKGPYRTEYWVNGEIQRAVKKDGTQEWFAPGCDDRDEAILHRVDGPAVIHPNNREEFWINGNQFNSREQWLGALTRLNDIKEEALDQELIDEDPVDEIYTEEVPATVKDSKTKKEKTMNKPSFTETLKANAVSAGYRVAGTQLTATVKGAILTVMRNKGADGGAIQAFSAFLDTEFGAAMISFMIGSGLPYVPHFGEDPRVVRLATELQVGGMATAGNAIIGEAMQHVLPAITQILQSLPAADGETVSNVRVIEAKDQGKLVETLESEEEESNTEETSAKTMNA